MSKLGWRAYSEEPGPPVSGIAARAYILQDFTSGRVLAESEADQRMEPASITKLMTAYLVFSELRAGQMSLEDQVTISEKAWRAPGSRTFVEVGKQVSVKDLLMGMIVQSGNDATIALAERVGGSETVFVSLMNETAKSLGMKNTHFMNSSGLPDPEHYTTARDLALLTTAVIRNFPEYYKWYSVKEFRFNGITQHNRNLLLWRSEHVDGVKTGHTESAGYCLVSSAIQDNMRLIAVVLGTASEEARAKESQSLLNYGFRFFETRRLYDAGEALTDVRIWKGESDQLKLGLGEELYITIPRGEYSNLKAEMNLPKSITAPVSKGSQYGTVNIRLNDTDIMTQPLIALQDVPEGNIVSRLIDSVKMYFE